MQPKPNTLSAEFPDAEIAALAYSYFEADGRTNGHDLEHWLRAERQLASTRKPKPDAEKTRIPGQADPGEHRSVRPAGRTTRGPGGRRATGS